MNFLHLFLIDKPKVSITRYADDTLEEGKAKASLRCGADANPPARVFWRKLGSTEERRFVESLEFDPVQRKDSGTYVCQAENSIGVSKEEAAEINVLCKLTFFCIYLSFSKYFAIKYNIESANCIANNFFPAHITY